MTDSVSSMFARRARPALSRRASLAALGMATISRPSVAAAKKRNKKGNKNGGERCKKQADECRTFFVDLCEALTNEPEECKATFPPCCASFSSCEPGAALNCIFGAISTS